MQRELANTHATVSVLQKSITRAALPKPESEDEKDQEIKLLQSEIKLLQVSCKR